MDIPVELINQPSVESGKLKEHCEWIIAQFEDELNQWFFNRRMELPISVYLAGFVIIEYIGDSKISET